MDKKSVVRVPTLNLSFKNLNANHKLKFYLQGVKFYWLFRLTFARSDNSIYLTPIFKTPPLFKLANSEEPKQITNIDFHISFHDSGIVNVTINQKNERIEPKIRERKKINGVFTLCLMGNEFLEETTIEETNRGKGQYMYLPISGFPHLPFFISVFYSDINVDWHPPIVSKSFQTNIELNFENKKTRVYLITWQRKSEIDKVFRGLSIKMHPNPITLT